MKFTNYTSEKIVFVFVRYIYIYIRTHVYQRTCLLMHSRNMSPVFEWMSRHYRQNVYNYPMTNNYTKLICVFKKTSYV